LSRSLLSLINSSPFYMRVLAVKKRFDTLENLVIIEDTTLRRLRGIVNIERDLQGRVKLCIIITLTG